jgi:hypothetical protein
MMKMHGSNNIKLMHSCDIFIVTVIMYELCTLSTYVVFVICFVVVDYFHIPRFF